MRAVLKTLLTHPFIWIYILLFVGLMGLTASSGLLFSYWYLLLLPLPILPFFEWVAHKFLLHAKVDPEQKPRLYRYMKRLHYEHHRDPKATYFIFAPLSASFSVFLFFFVLFVLVFRDLQLALVPEVSVVGLFLFYEWTHLAHHTPQYRPKTEIGKKLKLAHSWHHYHNENYWWGITSHVADLALGTFGHPDTVPKSSTSQEIEKSGG